MEALVLDNIISKSEVPFKTHYDTVPYLPGTS